MYSLLYLFKNCSNVSVLETLILGNETTILFPVFFVIIIIVVFIMLLASLSTVPVAWQLSDSNVQTIMFQALLYVIES